MRSECVQPLTLRDDCEKDRVALLRTISAPHIRSFNYALGHGLQMLPHYIEPVVTLPSKESDENEAIKLWVKDVMLQKPKYSIGSEILPMYPHKCLQAGVSYLGDMYCTLGISINGEEEMYPSKKIGQMPIMVGSSKCNLSGKTPDQLVKLGEEEYEFGGYFVVNGSEKVMRMTLVPRSNHPVTARRDKNSQKGPNFSDLSLSVRCERADLSTLTFHLQMLKSGGVLYRFRYRGNDYFLPVGLLLRALLESGTSYKEIFELIVGGHSRSDNALYESALAILTDLRDKVPQFRKKDTEDGCSPGVSKDAATAYLGRSFRVLLNANEKILSDYDVGVLLLRQFICPHLSRGYNEGTDPEIDFAKAQFLIHLCRKLVFTFDGEIEVDNSDALSHLQVLLPGNLYLMQVKERLSSLLQSIAYMVRTKALKLKQNGKYDPENLPEIVKNSINQVLSRPHVGERLKYLISTGNIRADDNLDMTSTVGFSVMAERINFLRFMSHFRAVHRGAFYAQMRSTKVRKLLPEAWGFICPVHTPDGDPCGILNHLASSVQVTQGYSSDVRPTINMIRQVQSRFADLMMGQRRTLPVVFDGRIIEYVSESVAEALANELRNIKVSDDRRLVSSAEVVLVPRPQEGRGFYQGIYICTNGGRLVRPVRWLKKPEKKNFGQANGYEVTKAIEYIGTFEQVFLRVRLAGKDQNGSLAPVYSKQPTHEEISSSSFLSEVASLSPFPDMNQGPRNMFQCQMAKQAMGTPCHVFSKRFEAKTYRLTCPQSPITRNFCMQDPLGIDAFGNGLNAVVAVISYTGNDMEDALILNQGSVNRGFAHGTVYETKTVDLDSSISTRDKKFAPVPENDQRSATIGTDGLPEVGSRLKTGAELYGFVDSHMTESDIAANSSHVRWTKHKSVETHTVDSVVLSDKAAFGSSTGGKPTDGVRHAKIRTRVSRTPIIGDKFASRAGQKGTVAATWPMEDMPFSENGIVPDIMFNPNGFPSRMTIGMMVESMAGKAGALHGRFQDSTPFCYDEKERAVEYFADQLKEVGYHYYGSETLYSGYTGEPFEVEIFMGVVHYQRLRHMVSDKFQVRSTGKMNPTVKQPIKGRKKGGAIRFGEMERDGVLAHGASAIIRERLGSVSDMHLMHVCQKCGSMVSLVSAKETSLQNGVHVGDIYCLQCGGRNSNHVKKVNIPYSFKFLVSELVAMNIRTEIKLTTN